MRRHLLLPVLALAAVVLLAAPASAKGPSEATIDGEGMAAPIDLMNELGPTAFWEVTDELGYVQAVGQPHDATVPAPTGGLGPMLTVRWAGPQTPTEDFDVVVELYLWAEDGPRLHVLPGQESIMNAPTEDEWFAMSGETVTVLHEVGVPSRAVLAAAQSPAPPAPPLRADSPDPGGFPWTTVLAVAALGLGGLAVAGWARRRSTESRRAVAASA